jgi:hypothetical protein
MQVVSFHSRHSAANPVHFQQYSCRWISATTLFRRLAGRNPHWHCGVDNWALSKFGAFERPIVGNKPTFSLHIIYIFL